MLPNNLQLNDNKMKILVFHARHRPALSLDCLQVVSAELKPTDHARSIGVIIDSIFSFDKHIAQIYVNLLFTQLGKSKKLERV